MKVDMPVWKFGVRDGPFVDEEIELLSKVPGCVLHEDFEHNTGMPRRCITIPAKSPHINGKEEFEIQYALVQVNHGKRKLWQRLAHRILTKPLVGEETEKLEQVLKNQCPLGVTVGEALKIVWPQSRNIHPSRLKYPVQQ